MAIDIYDNKTLGAFVNVEGLFVRLNFGTSLTPVSYSVLSIHTSTFEAATWYYKKNIAEYEKLGLKFIRIKQKLSI